MKIAVVTVGRSDYGLYRPILDRLRQDPDVTLQLIVSGAHFSEKFGRTVIEIERDGFRIAERLPLAETDDTPLSVARVMGEATCAFAMALDRLEPDLLLLLGDRFEMHSAAVAALPLRVPVAHVHGGELTFGAIDDALRHSITKLAHLHFPSTEEYATRIRQLGEESWRITVSGAPGLDNLTGLQIVPLADFAERHRIALNAPPLLVTFHPVTLEHDRTGAHVAELLAALGEFAEPILFTLPNADTGHQSIIRAIREFATTRPKTFVAANLGTRDYFSAMAWSAAMIGNSSSGIIEAASFELPVVNIGSRQAGRVRTVNVIDCGHAQAEVAGAIRQALNPAFRSKLVGLKNPYGDGHATERIVSRLKAIEPRDRLLLKRFADLPA